MTELHYAAYCGDLDALLYWLEAGLAVNATDTYRGYTPTHWLADMAAAGGPRVEMLLSVPEILTHPIPEILSHLIGVEGDVPETSPS